MTLERRRHKRYDILAQMRIKQDDTTYIMSVDNISRSGILVSQENSGEFAGFALNQELEMNLFTIEGLENIRIVGRVVRVIEASGTAAKQGYGIEFSFMTEAARNKLSHLVTLAKEDSIHPPPLK